MLAVRAQKRFKGFVLDVAFEADGSLALLSGPSGAGKSLLLGILAGVVRPDAGRAALDGDVLFDRAGGRETPPHRRGVGCVFQDARLFPHKNVRDNLSYGLNRAGGRTQRFGFAEVVDVLGLGALLNRAPGALSGGEAQRVAIGRALLSQPRLLLLDEPLSALDAPMRREILQFIQRVREAFPVPMVYASHDREELERLGGILVRLKGGRVMDVADLVSSLHAPSLIRGTLEADDETGREALCVRAGSERWPVSGASLVPGACVSLMVAPRDVLLALERPALMSADVVVRARVRAIVPCGDESRVALESGFGAFGALIPEKAVAALGLASGCDVYAVVARTRILPGD